MCGAYKAENGLRTSLSAQDCRRLVMNEARRTQHTTEHVSIAHHHVEENGCARSWLVLCHPPQAKSTPTCSLSVEDGGGCRPGRVPTVCTVASPYIR